MKITIDVIARRGKREINGTFTGLKSDVEALIDDLVMAGWIIVHKAAV